MIERHLTVEGTAWSASIVGRVTPYDKDELSVVFTSRDAQGRTARRISRFSPQGTRSRAQALDELPESDLAMLFRQSQPDWTSPELNYAR